MTRVAHPFYADEAITLYAGKAGEIMAALPDGSVNCCVTSPPYYALRDYGVDGQLGAEPTPQEYVDHLVDIMRQVRRVLADDGTCWLNIGDSFASKARGTDNGWDKSRLDNPGAAQKAQAASMRRTGERHRGKSVGIREKSLLGIPWRVALALQDDGWILRNDIIWHKPNAMPESVADRLSCRHEHLFLLTKQPRYWFNVDPIRVPHVTPPAPADPAPVDPDTIAMDIDVTPVDAPVLDGTHRGGASYQRGNTALAFDGRRFGGNPGSTLYHGAQWNELGRNPGDVWSIPTVPFKGEHFAPYPPELVRRCISAGCKPGGVVLDPFHGSGTTGMVAAQLGHRYVGIDLNPDYLQLSLRTRLADMPILPEAS